MFFHPLPERTNQNKKENKSKITSKLYAVLYFHFLVFLILLVLLCPGTTPQQCTQGARCLHPGLSEQGRGSPGDTKMDAPYVLSRTSKRGDAEDGGHDGGRNLQHISGRMTIRTLHMLTCAKGGVVLGAILKKQYLVYTEKKMKILLVFFAFVF